MNYRVLISFMVVYSVLLWFTVVPAFGDSNKPDTTGAIPYPLDQYQDEGFSGLLTILRHRIEVAPFNLVASLVFLCAIIHTFLTSKFTAIANRLHHQHERRIAAGTVKRDSVHIGAGIFHFLGEVEAVFGLWVIPLAVAVVIFFDWHTVVFYVGEQVNFTEPLFVMVIMTLAATRPILNASETLVKRIAGVFGGNLVGWWMTILIVGPLLGSFITEPAAMTISALLLGKHFYRLEPSNSFKYATIGLLFVNISVGGTLTHFAAPPVLMVAGAWGWDTLFMTYTFGWKAALGIFLSTTLYLVAFRGEVAELQKKHQLVRYKQEIQQEYVNEVALESELERMEDIVIHELRFEEALDNKVNEIKARLKKDVMENIPEDEKDRDLIEAAFEAKFDEIALQETKRTLPALLPKEKRPQIYDPAFDDREDPVPPWIIAVHMAAIGWTVLTAHYPPLFIPGLLFLLGFAQVTSEFQNRIDLRTPIMVGFFLGGLVIHGGLQGWWIDPILSSLSEVPLMLGATILTAFNDNAAITYLSTLVPGFTAEMKYAVVAGAVAGGGLTVIANAPNPAGQTLLKGYYENGISPVRLLGGAFIPTIIMVVCFLVFRG